MTAAERTAVYALIPAGDDPPDGRLAVAHARARIRERRIRDSIRAAICASVAARYGRDVQGQAQPAARPVAGQRGPVPGILAA